MAAVNQDVFAEKRRTKELKRGRIISQNVVYSGAHGLNGLRRGPICSGLIVSAALKVLSVFTSTETPGDRND